MAITRTISLLFCIVAIISCENKKLISYPGEDDGIAKNQNRQLLFDLSDDDHLKAGLFVKEDSSGDRQLLPFKIQYAVNDESYLSAAASYKDFSIIYTGGVAGPDAPYSKIYFTPDILYSEEPSDHFYDNRLEDRAVYLKKSTAGQDRQFIYNMEIQNELLEKWKLSDTLDLITIHIPENSLIHESDGIAPIPNVFEHTNKFIRSFPGYSPKGFIKLSYSVPLSERQRQFAKQALDLAKTLAPFIASLVIFFSLKNPRAKKLVSFAAGSVTFLIFVFLAIGLFSENNLVSNFLLLGNAWDYIVLSIWLCITILFGVLGIKA